MPDIQCPMTSDIDPNEKMVLHTINYTLVEKLGNDYLAADLFQYICYWVLENELEDKNYIDGKYWTYFSVQDLIEKEYHTFSKWQIKQSLANLMGRQLIKRGNHNSTQFDRTPWYTVDKVDIEFYQPNLVKLFKKKLSKKARLQMQPSTVENPTNESGNTARPRVENQPSTVGNPTEPIYKEYNHTNNQPNNQEKKEISSSFYQQHKVVNMVDVESDSSHTREDSAKRDRPFSFDEWKFWQYMFPPAARKTVKNEDADLVYRLVDKYGKDLVVEYCKYYMDRTNYREADFFLGDVERGLKDHEHFEEQKRKNGGSISGYQF